MATKPKAILSTMDNREASPITKASNVLFENGQTAQDILNDRQDTMISPVIENSSSMFKVGQGDNVDYSNNVVNGAYESMVLKGKSMVNCIQEPSSQDVVLPYEFADGQYVTINDTKESGALGVELKGQTLVNIHDKKTPSLAAAENDWYSNLVIETNSISFTVAKLPENWRYINFKSLNLSMLKPNTKYLVTFEEASGVSTVTFKNGDSTHPLSDTVQIVSNKAIVTTTSDWVNSAQILYIYVPVRNVGAEVKVKNPMIIEYVEGMENWDIPYFEGMASCKMPTVHTVGKNLLPYNEMFVSPFTSATPYITKNIATFPFTLGVNGRGVGIKFKVEPNTTYTLSSNIVVPNTVVGVAFYKNESDTTNHNNKLGIAFSTNIEESTKTFTTPNECNWIVCGMYILYTYEQSGGTVVISEMPKLQLEKNTQATTYESYKSSILSLPEEVALRSLPNGVCDTFNTRTGVYTQRIGELILDGSLDEYWTDYKKELDTTQAFYTSYNIIGKCYDIISNSFPTITKGKIQASDIEGISTDESNERGFVFIRIKKSRLSTQDTDGFKAWLQSNPVTVQYQLETPVITKINLSSTLKSWNTTTHIYSEIPENTLYPILSHSNPSYPVILKPSTKYSIVANSYSNSHTNSAINFNLGGATASTTVGNRVTTITTPSTLSNELLTMSGRGNKLNNVMVIEGDVVGDEPYFEGICDCKSPILSNVGKNLFGVDLILGAHTYGNVGVKPTHGTGYPRVTNKTGDYIPVKPNTTYIFSINNNISFAIAQLDSNGISLGDTGWVNHKSSWTMTTHSMTHFIGFNFKKADDSTIAVDEVRNASPMLEESSTVTSYKPYKTNILSANGDKIELTEDMFEQGAIAQYINSQNIGKTYQWMKDNSDSNYDKRRLRLKNLVKVKPNTKLILQNTDNFMYAMSGFDSNKLSLGTFDTSWIQNAKVTIPQDVHYISLFIRKKDDTGITINDFKNAKFTLSEVDKTIVLRSLPNGVCDTLNVETGEYVQRVREVILNGSEEWYAHGTYGYALFDINGLVGFKHITTDNSQIAENIISNSIPITNIYYLHNDNSNQTGLAASTNSYSEILLSISEVPRNNVTMLKQYLSQNPITVQYELATPVIKTVDLSGYPFAYKDGHVVLSSGSIEQSLTPKVEYSVATNRNGQIRSNQKMVERHQKQLDQLQAIILANLVNSQYNQTLTTLKYELSRV